MNRESLAKLIRDIPDFPEPGVTFKDITPVLADAAALQALIEAMVEPYRAHHIDKVVGIESRGFILAAPIASSLRAGFVPLRKPGKLPAPTHREEYVLEYGVDSLEVHVDAVRPGERVLIVDDVIATGGTAVAAIALMERCQASVVGMSVFIELEFLGGRAKLDGLDLNALVAYA